MIARVWRGAVRAGDGDAYLGYLRRTGERDCRGTPGNRGVTILRQDHSDRTEFIFISYWESLDAIAAFAGADLARARYYPEDSAYLLALDPSVEHFEVTGPPLQ